MQSPRRSGPEEGGARVMEQGTVVGEQLGAELAVDQPVVEGERELGDPARLDRLAAVRGGDDPRGPTHRAEGEDDRLPLVEDRGPGVDAEDTDVGDRRGATGHVGRLGLPVAGGGHEVTERTGEVVLASRSETEAAIASAAAAFPAWRDTSLSKRVSVLFAFRELLNARKEELAAIITAEQGKVLADALGEISRGQEVCLLYTSPSPRDS